MCHRLTVVILISTIDVGMQDICEKALVDKLKELNASVGVVVLMEVATGEVKGYRQHDARQRRRDITKCATMPSAICLSRGLLSRRPLSW